MPVLFTLTIHGQLATATATATATAIDTGSGSGSGSGRVTVAVAVPAGGVAVAVWGKRPATVAVNEWPGLTYAFHWKTVVDKKA
jgi:hypothetical protein